MVDETAGEKRASRQTKIVNKQGWHARPSALVVKTANKFKSQVSITINGETANGKSIMEVIMLASPLGTGVLIETCGEDADDAAAAIASLVEAGFGEELA